MKIPALILVGCVACSAPANQTTFDSLGPRDARDTFGDTVAAALLDTVQYEFRAQLFVKVPNPNTDDESPLVDEVVAHPSSPGPHTSNGTLYAELGALQKLLGRDVLVRVDTTVRRVFVGSPAVLLDGHLHGNDMYVPVKLFARQFGAYTDIRCTLANCAFIWPRSVIEHMTSRGLTGGTGMLEAHAEGLAPGVDVTRLPGG